VDFDELVLMPTERKSIKTILKYTNELVRQSVLGIDTVLKALLVKDVSDALDTALLTGAGTSDSITGIINQPDVTTGPFDVMDADSLLDAIGLLTAQEVMPNRWFVNGQDFIDLRKLKTNDTDSKQYLLESDVTAGPTYRLWRNPRDGDEQAAGRKSGARRHVECRCGTGHCTVRDRADRTLRGVRPGGSEGRHPLRPRFAAPRGCRGPHGAG
jgi:hypothetical protein